MLAIKRLRLRLRGWGEGVEAAVRPDDAFAVSINAITQPGEFFRYVLDVGVYPIGQILESMVYALQYAVVVDDLFGKLNESGCVVVQIRPLVPQRTVYDFCVAGKTLGQVGEVLSDAPESLFV